GRGPGSRSTTCCGTWPRASAWSSRSAWMIPTPASPRPSRSGRAPTGWSARCSICSASGLPAIPTCDASSCPRSSRRIPCGRIIPCGDAASGTTSRGCPAGSPDPAVAAFPFPRQDDAMSTEILDEPELETQARQATWTLNFGPQHPATHTTLRLILELDGERVVKATPDIGYLHSGFEKLGEHLSFNQYVTIVDRKNYISPPMNEVAWHYAVEKLLGVELTPRCQYIRVIIAELSRISDHLLCTGAAALDLGAYTAFLYAFNLRELIYDVYEEMSGYRFHPGYTRVGGLLYDFNDRVLARVAAVLESFA